MILRTAILGAMVLCSASLAMAEEVLYCTDTAGTGFYWNNTEIGTARMFYQERFTLKVISDTQRVIASMSGDIAGKSLMFTCHPSYEGQIVCNDLLGGEPWIFYKNNYTRAYLQGPPVGPPNSMDPNIEVAYGTCARF